METETDPARVALLEYAASAAVLDPSTLWTREQIAADVRTWADQHYPSA